MSESKSVFRTGEGRICRECGRAQAQCTCRQKPHAAPKVNAVVRVSRATQGRRGKGVTLISGVPLNEAGLLSLARELKARCGAGGAVKDGVIEIQGEHRDTLLPLLEAKGWTVRRAGG